MDDGKPTPAWARRLTAAAGSGRPGGGQGRLRAFRIGLTGALGVGVGLVVWGMVSTLATLILLVGLALFAALGLDPVISWLERRRLPRSVAVTMVFAALVAAAAALLYWMIPILAAEIRDLITVLPRFITQLARSQWVNNIEVILAGFLDVDQPAAQLSGFFSDTANLIALAGGILSVGAGIIGALSGALIVLILTLYFVSSLGRLKNAAYNLVPASSRAQFIDVAEDIARSISHFLVGQLALSLINGSLSALFLSLIGAPAPLLLAVVAFFGSLVPMVGTIASSAVITLVCLASSPQTALAAGIYYLIYMQVEAYILTPRIMDKAVNVPGSLVLIAVVAGGTLGGVLGALVAVPLTASAVIVLRRVIIPRQNRL
jgi:predicted PurR-regulated permease PerM